MRDRKIVADMKIVLKSLDTRKVPDDPVYVPEIIYKDFISKGIQGFAPYAKLPKEDKP